MPVQKRFRNSWPVYVMLQSMCVVRISTKAHTFSLQNVVRSASRSSIVYCIGSLWVQGVARVHTLACKEREVTGKSAWVAYLNKNFRSSHLLCYYKLQLHLYNHTLKSLPESHKYHPLSENYQQSVIAPLRFAASKVKDLTRVGLVAYFYWEEKVVGSKVVSGWSDWRPGLWLRQGVLAPEIWPLSKQRNQTRLSR